MDFDAAAEGSRVGGGEGDAGVDGGFAVGGGFGRTSWRVKASRLGCLRRAPASRARMGIWSTLAESGTFWLILSVDTNSAETL